MSAINTPRLRSRVKPACALVILVALSASCARHADNIIRFGLATVPVTLDPRFATDATSYRLCRLLYSALVDFDTKFRPIPALATWEVLAPTRYRFHLQRAPRFHDGTVLGASDVVATYQAILNPARASPHRGALLNVRTVSARDSKTIDFELIKPDPQFPGLLVIGILRAADATRDALPEIPIGSGPFRLVTQLTPTRVAVERVADGQRIDFLVTPNETTRALKLARGELDLAQNDFSPDLIGWLRQQPGLTVTRRAGTVFSYLGLNLARGPTRDPHVRLALGLALDRATLVHYLFRDQARLANTELVPEHWAGDADVPAIPFDQARSRELLRRAGFDSGHPLVLHYKTSTDNFRRRIATIFQAQLHQVGVELQIETHDWGTLYGDIKAGRFEIFSLSWVGLQSPDIFRHAFHSTALPPAGANRGHYANPRVDALIEQAETAADNDTQARFYRELQAILQRDLPYIPLWFEDTVFVHGPRVIGYDTDLNGHYDGLSKIMPRVARALPGPSSHADDFARRLRPD